MNEISNKVCTTKNEIGDVSAEELNQIEGGNRTADEVIRVIDGMDQWAKVAHYIKSFF